MSASIDLSRMDSPYTKCECSARTRQSPPRWQKCACDVFFLLLIWCCQSSTYYACSSCLDHIFRQKKAELVRHQCFQSAYTPKSLSQVPSFTLSVDSGPGQRRRLFTSPITPVFLAEITYLFLKIKQNWFVTNVSTVRTCQNHDHKCRRLR